MLIAIINESYTTQEASWYSVQRCAISKMGLRFQPLFFIRPTLFKTRHFHEWPVPMFRNPPDAVGSLTYKIEKREALRPELFIRRSSSKNPYDMYILLSLSALTNVVGSFCSRLYNNRNLTFILKSFFNRYFFKVHDVRNPRRVTGQGQRNDWVRHNTGSVGSGGMTWQIQVADGVIIAAVFSRPVPDRLS